MTALRILFLEDRQFDVDLMLREIRKAGFEVDWKRVETGADFTSEISGDFDIVIADYSLPQFDALQALQIIEKEGHDIPVIVVTGTVSEEMAVECMKRGASDYLLKDRLIRLGHSVTLALEQKKLKIAKRESDYELQQKEEQLRLILENTLDVIFYAHSDGIISYISPQIIQWGIMPEQVTGKHLSILVHDDDRERITDEFNEIFATGKGFVTSFRLKAPDDRMIIVEKNSNVVTVEGKSSFMTGSLRNITARRYAEERIKASLREKETLLQEIHHRVKNNLQIILSLLRMQMRTTSDLKVIDILTESQNRILSMALIHEKLYNSQSLVCIDINSYISDLVKNLMRTYRAYATDVNVEMDIENISIDVDTAIPCGLLVNELISNALKHAFPMDRKGTIAISFRRIDELWMELVVRDDGCGLPDGFDFRQSESLGMQLITTLSEDQLDGKVALRNDGGACFTISLKAQKKNHKCRE